MRWAEGSGEWRCAMRRLGVCMTAGRRVERDYAEGAGLAYCSCSIPNKATAIFRSSSQKISIARCQPVLGKSIYSG